MAFKAINPERNFWNRFLKENNGSFLQSFEWAEIKEKDGKKVWFFKDENEKGITTAQFLLIKDSFFYNRKEFFYIPFGPVFRNDLVKKEKLSDKIVEAVKGLANEERVVFLKIEPYFSGLSFEKPMGVIKELKRIQPKRTIFLDLEKGEDELLKSFHFRTRYNIRLGKRKGIKVLRTNKEGKDFNFYLDKFYSLLLKTSRRQKFNIYSKNYYQNILTAFDQDFQSELFLAEYKKNFIAGSIVVFWNKIGFYLHSGSDYFFRNLKAPFVLLWEEILEAKKKGCLYYDLWGIDEKRYPGITYFKKNFNGEEREYPEGADIIFDRKWYYLYKILKKVK
ncbi:MAG TPA: peptidoglycan bridge formation glycyltransferase FemA/FemB family protein [Candidatus Parcubacteria bacterium]|nr:peptidoglycan bridge formation glycyltransferase FemA/FemB family protein [Candidatus Parcubacteria bacterium]